MKNLIALLVLGTTSFFANATLESHGSLSRDTTQNFILDSLNNRSWMGWDKTYGYTLAQTLAQTGVGGVFDGYSVAHRIDAQLFANALLGNSNLCDVDFTMASCGFIDNHNIIKVLGPTYYRNQDVVFNSISFLSDNLPDSTGLIEVLNYYELGFNNVTKYNWSSVSSSDYMSVSFPNIAFGYLLYKDNAIAVPEPASIALFALAGVSLLFLQRRRFGTHIQ